MQLDLLRVQHGVGQGGFHTSSFVIVEDGEYGRPANSFDFVFDCGTVSKCPGAWASDLIAERIHAHYQKDAVVDALLSRTSTATM